MPTTEPTQDQLAQFAAADQSEPFTMVNLLKFRGNAIYPAGSDEPERSGVEAYEEYTKVVIPKMRALGGKLTYRQKREQLFVGDLDQDIDEVIIVSYPSREAYLQMFHSDDYQAAIKHRIAGLEYRILLQCPEDV